MSDKPVEKVIKNAVKLLREIYPQSAYLYFPLLSTALVWAVRRPKEWEESIFSWQVWPDPDYIRTKPNDFVLEFFSGRPSLKEAYSEEIQNKDWKTLRAVFIRLYPIFGLDDPFLKALFKEEVEAEDFPKIVLEFDSRVEKAKQDIRAVKANDRLLAGLKTFGEELASLSTAVLAESDVQRSLQEILEEHLKGKK
ncbi:MAG: hypothetical protein PVH84_13525 [Candidatus Aminicenantes bacterium]|jgi:hypothetical protein